MRRSLMILGLTTVVAMTAAAQVGPRARMRPAPRAGVEDVLRMRERLELTPDQLTRLRAFREEALAARIAATTEFMRLRSALRAGEVTRAQVRERLQAQRESTRTRLEAMRPERIRELLTEAQREKLMEARREAMRAEARLRMQARRPMMRPDRFRARRPTGPDTPRVPRAPS